MPPENRNTTKRFVRLYLERGYHCINYDMRGHGSHVEKDGGIKPFLTKDEICTFGEREARDLLSLIYDAYHRFGDDITLGLHGESLGAATSMLVLKYQPRLDFVVEDCGFAEVLGVQKQVLRDRNLPEVLVYPASLAAKGLYGVAFTDIKPVEAVKESRVPLLVIHGEADELIDVENAHRIYDAAQGKKKLVLFPGALHGRSYDSDPARYQAVINEFLDEIGC